MAASEDRSEKPTQRRIEKAREEGKVLSSRQFVIAIQVLLVYLFVFRDLSSSTQGFLDSWTAAFREVFVQQAPRAAILQLASIVQSSLLPWFVALVGLSASLTLAAQLGASQGAVRFASLQPDFKKLFSPRKLAEGYQDGHKRLAIFALAVCGIFALAFYPSFASRDTLNGLRRLSLGAQILYFSEPLLHGAKYVLAVFVAIGLTDFGLKLYKLQSELKMTKKEVQDESKDSNGNPLIKAALKRRMKALLSNRMMQQIPEATVVVVNPTHFAVALQYDPASSDAPLVSAKGVDYLALRIRRKAEECGVPVVENPPLAQALYKSAEVGQKIPVDLYRAVAEVLAYVFRVLGRRAPSPV